MKSLKSKSILLFLFFFLLLLASVNLSLAVVDCDDVDIPVDIQVYQRDEGLLILGTASNVCTDIEITLYCGKEYGHKDYHIQPVSGSWEQLIPYEILKDINCCGPPDKTLYVGVSCFNKDTFKCANMYHPTIKCEGEGECPSITLQANIPECSDRNQDGTWPVQFNLISQPGEFTGNFNVIFGDGETNALSNSTTSFTHLYNCPHSAPAYYVSVVANGCISDPLHTSSDTITLDFPACECPVIENISSQIDDCTVVLSTSVSTCSESVTQYIWNFGDGHAETSDAPMSSSHTYTHNGTYTVTVTLAGAGNNCSSTTTIDITQCEQNGNGNGDDPQPHNGNGDDPHPHNGNGDDDSSICGIFDWCCWLLGIFMGLYIAFWVMWNYNILPAAWYVGGAALVAFLLWLFICQPTYCGVLTVLFSAGIVALAIMGVIALVPGAPTPPTVIPGVASSYPASILTVLTLIVIPLLFLSGECVANCNDFASCFMELWRRAGAGL